MIRKTWACAAAVLAVCMTVPIPPALAASASNTGQAPSFINLTDQEIHEARCLPTLGQVEVGTEDTSRSPSVIADADVRNLIRDECQVRGRMWAIDRYFHPEELGAAFRNQQWQGRTHFSDEMHAEPFAVDGNGWLYRDVSVLYQPHRPSEQTEDGAFAPIANIKVCTKLTPEECDYAIVQKYRLPYAYADTPAHVRKRAHMHLIAALIRDSDKRQMVIADTRNDPDMPEELRDLRGPIFRNVSAE